MAERGGGPSGSRRLTRNFPVLIKMRSWRPVGWRLNWRNRSVMLGINTVRSRSFTHGGSLTVKIMTVLNNCDTMLYRLMTFWGTLFFLYQLCALYSLRLTQRHLLHCFSCRFISYQGFCKFQPINYKSHRLQIINGNANDHCKFSDWFPSLQAVTSLSLSQSSSNVNLWRRQTCLVISSENFIIFIFLSNKVESFEVMQLWQNSDWFLLTPLRY